MARRLGITLTGVAATVTAFWASFHATVFLVVDCWNMDDPLCTAPAVEVPALAVGLVPVAVIVAGTAVGVVRNRWEPLAITATAAVSTLAIVGVPFALVG